MGFNRKNFCLTFKQCNKTKQKNESIKQPPETEKIRQKELNKPLEQIKVKSASISINAGEQKTNDPIIEMQQFEMNESALNRWKFSVRVASILGGTVCNHLDIARKQILTRKQYQSALIIQTFFRSTFVRSRYLKRIDKIRKAVRIVWTSYRRWQDRVDLQKWVDVKVEETRERERIQKAKEEAERKERERQQKLEEARRKAAMDEEERKAEEEKKKKELEEFREKQRLEREAAEAKRLEEERKKQEEEEKKRAEEKAKKEEEERKAEEEKKKKE